MHSTEPFQFILVSAGIQGGSIALVTEPELLMLLAFQCRVYKVINDISSLLYLCIVQCASHDQSSNFVQYSLC